MCSMWFGLLKILIFCVKIVNTCPVLLEYHPCVIVKVYIDERFQFSVDGGPELGRHCGKG